MGAAGPNVPAEWRHVPVAAVPAALELVEDAVVLIQGAEFTAKVFMNLERNTSLSSGVRSNTNILTTDIRQLSTLSRIFN